jgi:hypothetical protein
VNRRTTGIAAAAVVVLALVVAGALALGGGDDEPRDAVSETSTEAAGGTAGYVLNASEGGPGFRVFASGADPAVARRVADELAYADL